MITLTFDEDLHATDPALANVTVTIGDQSYSGATFIASTVTDATNAEQLVITLADDVVAPIAADQKVYVTYSGSDLDDAAGNQVTQFTKLVDVSGSSTANAATDGITGASVDANGKVITLTFDEDLNATDPALANSTEYSGATFSANQHGDGCDECDAEQLVITLADDIEWHRLPRIKGVCDL